MKKLLALALAAMTVLAMGVTAFADARPVTSIPYAPEDPEDFGDEDLALASDVEESKEDSDQLIIRIYVKDEYDPSSSANYRWIPADDNDLEDIKMSAKVTDGKSYVKDISLEELETDDTIQPATGSEDIGPFPRYQYAVVITLKDYYDVSKETIKFEVTLKSDRGSTLDKQSYTHKLNNTDGLIKVSELDGKGVGVDLNSRGDEVSIDYADFTAKDIGSEYFAANVIDFEDVEYLELSADYFSFGVKMSDQGKLPMAYNAKVDKTVARMFDDRAELVFINFPGRPTFDFTGTASVYLPDEDEDWWLYEIDEDGDLTEVRTSLSDDDDALEFKTRTLGCYVLSDYELDEDYFDDDVKDDPKDEPADKPTGGSGTSGSTNDPNKGNPTTGSSDYVGVAVTLAVVSLAAAGAVTLKRKK